MFKLLKIENKISLQNLIIVSYILSILCCWAYGNSYILYATLSIGFIIFTYGKFTLKVIDKCSKMEFLVIVIIYITFMTSLLNNGIKSMLLVNVSLIMPFAISYLNINYKNVQRQIIFASLVNIIFVILILINSSEWNSNSLAFMIFNGVSIGFIWFKVARNITSKIWASIYLFTASVFLLSAESRNAGIVMAICIMLLMIPKRILKKKWLYRTIYLSAVLATVFASDVMTYIFENETLMQQLVKYTSAFSDKVWGMDTHLTLLLRVKNNFSESGILAQLLGEGIKKDHTHNLFYQSLYFYGYLGTIIIYGIYIIFFEIAYKLIKKYNNNMIAGCYIILIGHFLMQIGEVYMLGSESAIIISLLPAGLILNQKRKKELEYKRRMRKKKYENFINNTLL